VNKLTMIGGSGVLGLCLGLVMGGNGFNGQSLALAGLLALPPVAVGLVVADTKAQSKINQAESKASTALRSLDDISVKLAASEEREAKLKLELLEILQELGRSNELLKSCQLDCSQSVESINRLESSLAVATDRLGDLEAEVNEWEREFHTRVSSEAQKRYDAVRRTEIQRIQAENDEITNEALDIVRGFRKWAFEVDNRLEDKSEFVRSITNEYNSRLEGVKGSISTQGQSLH
jgi:chromosome segregation ATPase